MSARAIAVGRLSTSAVEAALQELRLALHEHIWEKDASAELNGEEQGTPPTDDELSALCDLYVRPTLLRFDLEPLLGDERDRYTLESRIFELAMTIGVVCTVAGYPHIDNTRQLSGLLGKLRRILAG